MFQGQLPLSSLKSIDQPFANRSDVPLKQNLVKIWNNQFVQTGFDDATSAVLLVAPSFNASLIGAGPTGAPLQPLFGNVDFKAYNIDFENRAVSFVIPLSKRLYSLHHKRQTFRSLKRLSQIYPMQTRHFTGVPLQASKTPGIPAEMAAPTSLTVSYMDRPIVRTPFFFWASSNLNIL
jgi:hypothetical protein